MDFGNMSTAQQTKSLLDQANYAGAGQLGCNSPVQSASDAIILRLNAIRSNLMDARDGLSHAADKIVGSAPTPIQQTGSTLGQIKGERPPASCFLDALQQVIGDIEIIGAEAHEHLNRLHRSF